MSKAILILSMPDRCISCPCFHCDDMKDWCGVTNDCIVDSFKILESCPLKSVPNSYMYSGHPCDQYGDGFADGYNTCLEEMLGQ